MKRIFPFLMLFFACFLFSSCGDNRTENRSTDILTNETSTNLQSESYSSDILGSFSRKRSINMIDKLYNEALERDEELNSLNDRISNIFDSQSDSLENFENYAQVNYDYWNTANNLLGSIRDSILRDEIQEIFTSMQSNYEKKMKPYVDKRNLVHQRSGELGNKKTILKLATSLDIIHKYQMNELPDMKQLDNILSEYDQLIEESVAMAKLEK